MKLPVLLQRCRHHAGSNRMLLLAFVLQFFVISWWDSKVSYPVFGSDELAYLMPSAFPEEKAQLYISDPHLQRISNQFFIRLQHGLSFMGDIREVCRSFNVVWFVLALGLLARLALLHVGPYAAGLLWLSGFILPNLNYTPSFMPECLYLLIYVSLFCLFVSSRPKSFSWLLCVAFLLSLLCYTKPHAISVVIAAFLTVALELWARREASPQFLRTLGLFGFLLYVCLIALPPALQGYFSLRPTFIGEFYSDAAGGAVTSILSARSLISVATYYGANFSIVLILFPLAIAAFFTEIISRVRRSECPLVGLRSGLVFGGFTLLITVAMVSVFTHRMGSVNAFEAMRVHERYYMYLYPCLLLVTLAGVMRRDVVASNPWLVVCMWFAGFCFILLVTLQKFKVYPWDSTSLFSQYTRSEYWDWASPNSYRWFVFGSFILCFLLFVMWRKKAVWLLPAWILIVFICARSNFLAWQKDHCFRNAPYMKSAHELGLLVPAGAKLSFIAFDRYGESSYALFGLMKRAEVRILHDRYGAFTSDRLAKGSRFCLAPSTMYPDFRYDAVVRNGPLNLYQLTGPSQFSGYGSPVSSSPREPFELTPSYFAEHLNLVGFNRPEPNLVWSSNEKSYLVLPREVWGKVQLKLVIWACGPNPNKKVRLRLGDWTCDVELTNEPREYAFDLALQSPARHLLFEIPVYRQNKWTRPLGFAFGRLRVAQSP